MLDGFSTLTDAFAAAVPRHPQPRSSEKPQKLRVPRLADIWQSQTTLERNITVVVNKTSPSPPTRILQPVNASTLLDSLILQPTPSQSPFSLNNNASLQPIEESHTIVRLSSAIHINHNLVPAILLTVLLLLLVCGHILYSLRLRWKRQGETAEKVSEERSLLNGAKVAGV